MISRNFIKSSIIYTLAGTLPMASAIILMPFYVVYLTPELLGALSIYLAFAVLVQILTTFSFDSSAYVHYHEYKHDPDKLNRFMSSCFVLMVMIGTGVSGIILVFGDFTFNLLFDDDGISFFPYAAISLATGILQAFFKVFTTLLQSQQKATQYFRSNLLSFSLIAAFSVGGLYLYPGSLIGPVGGRLLAGLVSGGWALFRVFREFGFHFDLPLLRSSFTFNFYAFIYQLQQWLINYFDRFVIAVLMPIATLGVYDFMMKCMLGIEFIINALYSSFLPRVVGAVTSQQIKQSTPEINRYYNGLSAVLMVLVSSCILVFPWIITQFVNRTDYHEAIHFIPFAVLFYLFKAMRLYFSIPYGILKYTKPLPLIYLIVSVIRIGGLVLAVPLAGIYGVIVSTLVSSWIEIFLVYYMGKRRYDFKFNYFKIIVAPVLLMILIISLEWMFDGPDELYSRIIQFIGCGILILWTFRNELKYMNLTKIITTK